jgi:hypothetical protein
MSECKTCGREDDGHWLGCKEAQGPWSDQGGDIHLPPKDSGPCAVGDCAKPTRPKGKGRAPIYCEDHSDPKSRK